ncbi:MAG: hypothetical protein K6B13_02065 [Prevotella sp.]|nr:hypothetical protein [Prevotella sp.]
MRQILTFVCLLLAIGTQAQTGTAKKAVDEIREQYASAKQRIEYNNKSEETRNQMTVNLSHMVPGTGHQEKVVTFYFTTYFDENVNEYVSKPYFITATYNWLPASAMTSISWMTRATSSLPISPATASTPPSGVRRAASTGKADGWCTSR